MSIIINSSNPYIFIHIPKTAGRSITETLKTQYEVTVIPNDRTLNSNYHSTIVDAQRLEPGIEQNFCFSIVRNPWDRMASWYFFRKNLLTRSLRKMRKNSIANKVSYKTPEEILKELEFMNFGLYEWLIEYKDRPWDYTWFSPTTNQCEWLRGGRFDKIIKFENLHKEIYELEIFQNLQLQELNISANKKSNYKDLYNKHSIRLIKKIYAEDIEMFGYSFDGN